MMLDQGPGGVELEQGHRRCDRPVQGGEAGHEVGVGKLKKPGFLPVFCFGFHL